MDHDLSANDLQSVRSKLTSLSFLILVFFFANGDFTGGALNLGFINVTFHEPQRLVYVVLGLLGWWMFRFYQCNPMRTFVDNLQDFILYKIDNDDDIRTEIQTELNKGYPQQTLYLEKNPAQREVTGSYSVMFDARPRKVNNLIIKKIKIKFLYQHTALISLMLPLLLGFTALTVSLYQFIRYAS